jgi:hypothetical protein
MKKLIVSLMLICLAFSLYAKPYRLKLGLNDYNTLLKDLNTKNGIYRFNSRLDVFNLSSRIGLGSAVNISFKSNNHDVDFYNNYDFYAHNLYGNKNDKGNYFVYGLLVGMRTNSVSVDNSKYWGKVTYTFTRLLFGAMVSRNDWGLEIICSQNQQNDFKLDFSTKYSFAGKYYAEVSYCYTGPVREIDQDFSLTLGWEVFNR